MKEKIVGVYGVDIRLSTWSRLSRRRTERSAICGDLLFHKRAKKADESAAFLFLGNVITIRTLNNSRATHSKGKGKVHEERHDPIVPK
jgi:hypothetical protein